MALRLRITLATDVGRIRDCNEDACAVNGKALQQEHGAPSTHELLVTQPVRIAVCDGMGGYRGGGTASLTAATELTSPNANLATEFQRVSDLLVSRGHADADLHQMGTTAVLLEVRPDGSASVLHVGDSRAYLADPELISLTIDDRILSGGPVLTQALGGHPAKLNVHRFDFNLYTAQRVLLCSDGLADVASVEQIEERILRDDAAAQLIDLALLAGAPDNVTVAVVEVLDSPKERSWG